MHRKTDKGVGFVVETGLTVKNVIGFATGNIILGLALGYALHSAKDAVKRGRSEKNNVDKFF
ncbi:hypothetical protein DSM07_00665 [Oenococcus sp. UCMA 16435]|nr:hypothetical protein DSM07_00665 [Oenococcus sp. UCMA 16435]MDI4583960.1 hypothetical protein [Oenococcus sp. UCMA 14587]